MNTISQRLRKKREEMNLSQAQLAEKAGMTQQSLQAIEAGNTKRPRFLLEIASVLQCDAHWLLYGEDRSSAPELSNLKNINPT